MINASKNFNQLLGKTKTFEEEKFDSNEEMMRLIELINVNVKSEDKL